MTKIAELPRDYGLQELQLEYPPRYNIAPTQFAPVVVAEPGRLMKLMKWGLVPRWAKDSEFGARLINARGDTLAEKPSFRDAFKRRRCLVPADGFFEWAKTGQSKTPYYFRLRDHQVFSMAGLWEAWRQPDGSDLLSFTIITTEPNLLVSEVHDRMPVILPRSGWGSWLDPGMAASQLQALLVPYPESEMLAHPVSRTVSSPANDLPECIQAVT